MTQWFRCVSLRNRVSLPLARKFVIVANKRIGGELLIQAAPELIKVVTKRKSPQQALKIFVKKQSESKKEGE